MPVLTGGDAARLEVEVRGDTTHARRELDQLDRHVDQKASRFGGAFQGIALAGGAAFAAVGVAAAGAVGLGTKVAIDLEQAEMGFIQVLGSAEAAGDYMAKLQKFAADTPFEFPDLQRAAGRFLAVGIEAERVIPIMTVLGDATSAMGTGAEGINRATTALTQMQQKGKVTAEEMMQLTEAGIPAWDALAAKLGVDVAGAMDQVSKRTVDAGVMFEALEETSGAALGRMEGGMKKQAQTLGGMLSTLKDTVMMGLADMAAPVVESLKGMMPAITGVMNDLMKRLGPIFGDVVTSLVSTLQTLLPAIAPVIEVLGRTLSTVLVAAAPLIETLGYVFSALAETFAELLPEIRPLLDLVVALAGTFLNLAAPIMSLIATALQPLLKALAPVLSVLGDTMMEVVMALIPVLESMGPTIRELGVGLGDLLLAFIPMIPAFGDMAIALIPLIPSLLQLATIGLQLAIAFLPVVQEMMPLMVKGLELLAGVLNVIIPPITAFVASILSTKGPIASAKEEFMRYWETGKQIVEFIKGIPGAIAEFVTGFPDRIREGIEGAINWLNELPERAAYALGLFIGTAISIVSELPGRVWSFLSQLPGRVVDAFTGMRDQAATGGSNLVSRVGEFMSQLPGKVWEFASQLPGKIAEAIGDMAAKARDRAGDVVSAFTGMGSKILEWASELPGKLAGKALDIGKSFVGGIKKGLGIASPSIPEKWFHAMHDNVLADADGMMAGIKQMAQELPRIRMPQMAVFQPSPLGPSALSGGSALSGQPTNLSGLPPINLSIQVDGSRSPQETAAAVTTSGMELVEELARTLRAI